MVMKVAIPVLVVVVLALWLALRLRKEPASGSAGGPNAEDTYRHLRDQALQGSRAKFGLPVGSSPTEPWAVLMDWGVTKGTASVVAVSDGNASVYLSSGGGFIGGVGQEAIRKAARNAVLVAREFQPQMTGTNDYPLPARGEVIFYALTDSGVFTAKRQQHEMETQHDSFSKLGNAMQAIITEYRLWDEQKRTGSN
jgi:hypothetical protein